MAITILCRLAVVLLCLTSLGCSSVYYSALEKVGIHKREVLVDRVKDVSDAQKEGEETFVDALEAFRSVVDVKPTKLSDAYDKIKSAYDDSNDAANAIRDRIDEVENVADHLFKEWRQELEEYESASLRSKSRAQLAKTEQRYKSMLADMHASRNRLDPVLSKMNDQVLYLKHNLNSQALGQLGSEVKDIKINVDALIASMRASIKESEAFIQSLEG